MGLKLKKREVDGFFFIFPSAHPRHQSLSQISIPPGCLHEQKEKGGESFCLPTEKLHEKILRTLAKLGLP